jgi:hypothetical protein
MEKGLRRSSQQHLGANHRRRPFHRIFSVIRPIAGHHPNGSRRGSPGRPVGLCAQGAGFGPLHRGGSDNHGAGG